MDVNSRGRGRGRGRPSLKGAHKEDLVGVIVEVSSTKVKGIVISTLTAEKNVALTLTHPPGLVWGVQKFVVAFSAVLVDKLFTWAVMKPLWHVAAVLG